MSRLWQPFLRALQVINEAKAVHIRRRTSGHLSFVMAVMALMSGLMLGGLGIGSASAHGKPAVKQHASSSPSVRLPVSTCPTDYANPGQGTGKLPTSASVMVPGHEA